MALPSRDENERAYYGEPGGMVSWRERGCAAHHQLPLRLDLANHSPTGFSWGYGGSGPAQLALALARPRAGIGAAAGKRAAAARGRYSRACILSELQMARRRPAAAELASDAEAKSSTISPRAMSRLRRHERSNKHETRG